MPAQMACCRAARVRTNFYSPPLACTHARTHAQERVCEHASVRGGGNRGTKRGVLRANSSGDAGARLIKMVSAISPLRQTKRVRARQRGQPCRGSRAALAAPVSLFPSSAAEMFGAVHPRHDTRQRRLCALIYSRRGKNATPSTGAGDMAGRGVHDERKAYQHLQHVHPQRQPAHGATRMHPHQHAA